MTYRNPYRSLTSTSSVRDHWKVPQIGRRKIPPELLAAVADELKLPRFSWKKSSNGVYGRVFYGIHPDRVVKLTADWYEAATAQWIRTNQRSGDLDWAVRQVFPRVHRVVGFEGPSVSAFVRNRVQHGLFAIVREDTATTDEAAAKFGVDAWGLENAFEPADFMGQKILERPGDEQFAVERSRIALQSVMRLADRYSMPHAVRNKVLDFVQGLGECAVFGLAVGDLHANNVRWRKKSQGRDWPKPMVPLVADFGMSAQDTQVKVWTVRTNPPAQCLEEPERVVLR